jgi:signal transduction histidine kinase
LLDEEGRNKFLQIIAANGRKVSAIVDELLLLASVRETEEIETYPLDMERIVTEARGHLLYLVEELKGEIILPAGWPLAEGHAPWVEEVWINYISNALKYGGRPPRVELGATTVENGQIRFWVRDNGRGLSPEEQARLFTPFERLHQARAKGHGLGLSIVQRIVYRLGGQVGVESPPPGSDRGSLFYFTLPAFRLD